MAAKTIGIGSALVGGVLLATVFMYTRSAPESSADLQESNVAVTASAVSVPLNDQPRGPLADLDYRTMTEGAQVLAGELTFDQLVALMQKHHGEELDSPLGQIDLINALLTYLRQNDPENWREKMEQLLHAAFPGLAVELLQLADNHLKYEAWFREGAGDIHSLDRRARMETLMQYRADFFGKQVAEELWQHEIREYEMAIAIEDLAVQSDRPLGERLEDFNALVRQQYSDEVLQNQSMAMGDSFANRFLSATQSELRAMSPYERRQTIAETRRRLGYSERAVENLDRLDRTRDQRWQAGKTYMESREAIMSQYQGEEREQRLREARQELLGAEADTIRMEEEAGFFRFRQERTYGIH